MGLLECASGASLWRGYDYFERGKVEQFGFIDNNRIAGTVAGGTTYSTLVDVAHPRKSSCNCPHADGKRIVCKHIVATYFAAFPEEAKKFYEEAMAYQEEEEQRQEEEEQRVIKYVHSLKKSELQQKLLELLFEGPEWQYDRFIRDHVNW